LHFKGTKTELDATQEALDRILSSVERMWFGTLDWVSQNQLSFYAILLLLAWRIYQTQRRKVDVANMKQEYEKTRRIARQKNQEQPLPLLGSRKDNREEDGE
jgi:hypothetical protein